jgi:hypothetical protein
MALSEIQELKAEISKIRAELRLIIAKNIELRKELLSGRKTMLRVGDVADILGVSPVTIHHWITSGMIEAQSRTAGGHLRFTPEYIKDFAARNGISVLQYKDKFN